MTDSERVTSSIAPSNGIPRPPSVWLTQIVLILFALMFLLILGMFAVASLPRLSEPGVMLFLVSGTAVSFGCIAVAALASWGLARRKPYGRRVSLVILTMLFLISASRFFRGPASGPFAEIPLTSPAQEFGAAIGRGITTAAPLILILRLGFAKNVIRFFQARDSSKIQ